MNFINNILATWDGYNEFVKITASLDMDAQSINIINGCLFVVGDLDLYINSVEKKGYVVSGGSPKYRGQISSLSCF